MPSLDSIVYAGFREWCRWWFLIERRAEYVLGSGLHDLVVHCGGSAGHSWARNVVIDEGPFGQRRWDVSLKSITESIGDDEAAREALKAQDDAKRRQRDREKLIKAAGKFPDGETLNVLRERAGLSGDKARAALADALEAGELEACQVTKANKQ